jgi:L-alanine-DL-glutamate epimerase-like enolase superfamily enzyme
MREFEAWLLRLPLVTPYKLAFGPVEALDTVIVRAGEGFGEATLLTGYTDETIEGTWSMVRELLAAPAAIEERLPLLEPTHPFLVTAFRTAMEMAEGSPLLALARPARVPILGLLQGDIEREAEALLAQGYRTLKVKAGFDPAGDARNVQRAQRAVAGRARLRVDANQGFTADQAIDFVSRLGNDSIELFEQPCAKDDWEAHLRVVPAAAERGIALMLDESIYTEREIERVAELRAAAFVKVKLMKFGSLARLEAAIGRIRALGLVPVLGNGVATDLGCWMEACVAARCIDNAGEMNGFLKPRTRLLAGELAFRDGAIEIPAGWRPRIDTDQLHSLSKEHLAWTSGPSTRPSARRSPAST